MTDISSPYLFILPIGDDNDDEELFAVLPARAFSIRVGVTRTVARYNLRERRKVIALLEALKTTEAFPRTAANHARHAR